MWSSVGRAVERVWSAGFALAGAAGPRARPWASAGGQRVVVVAPHPDDESAGCAGTVRLHVLAGDRVTVVHATDGGGSRALGLGPEAMALRRRKEAETALAVLGVQRHEWLGLREWEWRSGELVPLLARVLADTVPQVVYAPSCIDFHPEHVRVARGLADALAGLECSGGCAVVRIYQVQVPLTRLLVNLVASVAPVLRQTLQAIRSYDSQRGSLESALRLGRYAARAHRVPGRAEEFWEVSRDAYVDIHALLEVTARGTFRGIRRFPLTDPLAFARGRAARRRLLRAATLA